MFCRELRMSHLTGNSCGASQQWRHISDSQISHLQNNKQFQKPMTSDGNTPLLQTGTLRAALFIMCSSFIHYVLPRSVNIVISVLLQLLEFGLVTPNSKTIDIFSLIAQSPQKHLQSFCGSSLYVIMPSKWAASTL